VAEGSQLAGMTIATLAGKHGLIPLAFTPKGSDPQFLHDVPGDTALSPGDQLVVCGAPTSLLRLLESERGTLLPGVQWAGRLRRWVRTSRRTLWEVDLSVKIAAPILFLTILGSMFVFRYGLGSDWADGLYQTVNLVATGDELHGEDKPAWAK